MPRIALVCLCLVGACSFDADYGAGPYRCEQGKCPDDLVCRAAVCVEPGKDAAIDSPVDDVMPDGPAPDLTCFAPGILTSGVAESGTTVGRTNTMQSFCGGGYQTARDAVYEITTTAPNKQLVVSVLSGSLSVYVVNACMTGMNTPACLGGTTASGTTQITVTAAAAAPYYVVVDSLVAGAMGPYSFRVDVQ